MKRRNNVSFPSTHLVRIGLFECEEKNMKDEFFFCDLYKMDSDTIFLLFQLRALELLDCGRGLGKGLESFIFG